MITDEQWRIFGQHVKPNMTVRWGSALIGAWRYALLLENLPYKDIDRVHESEIAATILRPKYLRVQSLAGQAEWPLPMSVNSMEYLVDGQWLILEQVLALGDTP